MDDTSRAPSWSSERLTLIVLAVSSGILAGLVVLPYLQYVLLAAVIAYVLVPFQRALEPHVTPAGAAATLTVATVFAIIAPLVYVFAIAIQEGLEFATAIREGSFDIEDLEARLEAVGVGVELDDLYAAYQAPVTTGLQGVATDAFEIVGGIPDVLIGLTVTVFVLFSLLRDGDRLLDWIVDLAPFHDDIAREVLVELDRLMWASIVGNVVVAGIQALLLGVGLAVLGVPGFVFLTVAAFVFALLPLIGTFVVWLPVSAYLLVAGRPIAGVLLLGYGALVSVSDNYLRPAIIGHSGELDAAIVIVGIFGGLAVFGFVGLFVGPVILGGSKVILDVFAAE